nr:uncharacterized protein CTRU02_01571 [Colletotrichum truncatum]KAF6799892.1 hypothetical protein CTRU02_01571 [Colletotrichum truncatum]
MIAVSALPSQHPKRALAPTHLGCFADLVDGKRALNGRNTAADDMTVEKCAAFCSTYSLFGLEYGRECFCGNERDTSSKETSPTDCNFPCSGDSKALCGASFRLNIYSNPKPTVQGPATTLPGITSLGCFADTIPRQLPSKSVADGGMTAELCAVECAGYAYFGTQWSSECFCGNTAPGISAPASDCNMACGGDYNEMCGGGMRLNVYKFAPTTSTAAGALSSAASNSNALSKFAYKSCWVDKPYDRSLKAVDYRTNDMTVEKCAERCKAHSYFGLEFSSECYCGDTLAGQAAPEEDYTVGFSILVFGYVVSVIFVIDFSDLYVCLDNVHFQDLFNIVIVIFVVDFHFFLVDIGSLFNF